LDESAEYVDAFDVLRRIGRGGRGRSRLRDGEMQAAVWSGGVVVPQVGAQHPVEVMAVEDQ
jgi:hypothetical protein